MPSSVVGVQPFLSGGVGLVLSQGSGMVEGRGKITLAIVPDDTPFS